MAFLTSRTFVANLVLALLFFVLFFWGINIWLKSLTHHAESIEVPDLSGLHLDEAAALLQQLGLNYEVIDSAEFDASKPLGGVTDQYPLGGSGVKEDRVILLTINPFVARKIEMPNIIEKTLRRAIYDLESKGFMVGTLTYIPDIGKDVVLGLQVNGQDIVPGDKFEKGQKIDLIVGAGLSTEPVAVPYLKWLTLQEATLKAQSNGFNLGVLVYDLEITDTATAKIYKQNPPPSKQPSVRMGTPIDLWLTNDSTKISNDSLYFNDTDSLPTPSNNDDSF